MALFSRLVRLKSYFNHRQFSATAKPDSEANKHKIRTALSLLETNNKKKIISSAEQILYLALSDAVSTFPHTESSSNIIPSFLRELKTQPSLLSSLLDDLKARPNLQKERFFNHFITLYGQAGMFDSAIQTFKDMATLKIDTSTESLNVLLRAGLYKNTGISEVLKVFNELPDSYDIKRDIETYNILLEGFVPLGYCNHRETICSLLEQMWEESGVSPDDTTSNIFMDWLHKEKIEDSAQLILDMVDRNMFLLDDQVYFFGTEILYKLRKTSEALDLFFEKLPCRCIEPTAEDYQNLIHLCCEQGNLDVFIKRHRHMLMKTFLDASTEIYHCETLIEALCKCGQHETAYMACKGCISTYWFKHALESNLTPIKSLMCGLVKTSKHHIGNQLIELMEENGLKADLELYNLGLECMSELGKSVEAKALFEGLEAKNLKPDATTYLHFIKAISKEGNVEKVMGVYYVMREKGMEPCRNSYETIIKFLVGCGDSENALKVCKHCVAKEWFEDFFYSTDEATRRTLFSLVMGIVKDQAIGCCTEENEWRCNSFC